MQNNTLILFYYHKNRKNFSLFINLYEIQGNFSNIVFSIPNFKQKTILRHLIQKMHIYREREKEKERDYKRNLTGAAYN